jgi:hypothetical protein
LQILPQKGDCDIPRIATRLRVSLGSSACLASATGDTRRTTRSFRQSEID